MISEPNNAQILEIDLDSEKALQDFNKHSNHTLQPHGYNVLFEHKGALNPENRVLVAQDGSKQKVLVEGSTEPLTWDPKDFGTKWDWAETDVWAWLKTEDNTMFHVTFTTTGREKSVLRRTLNYFQKLLKSEKNVYVGEFAKFLPKGKTCHQKYQEEINYLSKKIQALGVGYLKRDESDPEFMVIACIPEENLSNEILEKWYETIVDFATSKLEEVNFTMGDIS